MADITASLVKELRDATNVSMMECKRALVEHDGNIEKATKMLREKGVAVAAKRASKATNCGMIASHTPEEGTSSLVEVNCETDFTAKNDDFQAFVKDLAVKAASTDGNLAEEAEDQLMDLVAAIGEKIIIKRNTRYQLQGTGAVVSYIHLGGKVGVLIEVGCEKEETVGSEAFQELAKDLSLHVAACAPRFMTSDEIPEEEIAEERAIFAKQVEGKPENIIDKIVDGKLQKFYSESCLLNQPFVKEDKTSITQLLEAKSKELGDNITIRRFARYQLGA